MKEFHQTTAFAYKSVDSAVRRIAAGVADMATHAVYAYAHVYWRTDNLYGIAFRYTKHAAKVRTSRHAHNTGIFGCLQSLYYLSALYPIGVSPFVKHTEHQRKDNAFVGDAEHEDVDVAISKLPVGTIHGQDKMVLSGKQREYHAGHDIKVKGISGDEALKPAHIGVSVETGRHGSNKFVET